MTTTTQPAASRNDAALAKIDAVAKTPVPANSRGVVLTSLDEMFRFAKAVSLSGMAPKGMDKPEAILVAIQLGLELGLSPMSALQNTAVINGRPGIFGDAALALVRGSGLCESYSQKLTGEGDQRKAVVVTKRKGEAEPLTSEFSVTDAKRAGLWGKSGVWQQYPDRMLLFRARGFNLRDNFGDVLKGLRTCEELQDMPADEVQPRPARLPRPLASPTPAPAAEVGYQPDERIGLPETPPQEAPDDTPTTQEQEEANLKTRLLAHVAGLKPGDETIAFLDQVDRAAEEGEITNEERWELREKVSQQQQATAKKRGK